MRGEDPLFGALRFAPEAGLCRFDPQEVDLELGASWLYPRPAIMRLRSPSYRMPAISEASASGLGA